MRFEAKNHVFKAAAGVIKNFINLPKSLAERHQLQMCYYHLNETSIFKTNREIRKGNAYSKLCIQPDSLSHTRCPKLTL